MKAPYFPFFVKNWLCSRRVLSMSGDAVKAYVYLLCEAWLQTPRATLPNDDVELESMSRLDHIKYTAAKKELMQHFKNGICDEHLGRLYNDTQLEWSRKWEKNQRPKNKNARRTRIKREVNAPLVNVISINSSQKEACLHEEVYQAYPKHVGKARAIKAIKAALKKIDHSELIIQVKKYANSVSGKDPQFIPHPSTWFNDERWKDETMESIPKKLSYLDAL